MLRKGLGRKWKGLFRLLLLVCLALVLEANQAFAADVTINENGTSQKTGISYNGTSFSVQLKGAYTGARCTGSKDWIVVSGSGDSYTITVRANSSEDSRNDTLTFTETRAGVTRYWQLKIVQNGKPHTHSWGDWTYTSGTCTTQGSRTRKCSCGEKQTESTGYNSSNHGSNSMRTQKKDATCTENGYSVSVCNGCGAEVGSRSTINKLGHNWGSWTTDKDSTCAATGTKSRVCQRCKEKQTDTIAKKEHTWGSWVTDKDSTCAAEGTKHRNCTKCSAKETGTIAKKNHTNNGKQKKVDATCTVDGYTVTVCSICDAELGQRTPIKAGHTWGAWKVDKEATCTAAGSKSRSCTKCGKKETETIKVLGHLVQGQIKTVAATCTKDGYKVVVCSRCGIELGEREVIKAGHSWNSWVVDKEASCEAGGSKHRTCKNCNAKQATAIPQLGHLVNGKVKTVAATCLKEGYRVVVCSRCGKEQGERTILAATGHNWDKWITDKDSTCHATGTKHRLCTRCNARQDATIPKKDHVIQGQIKRVEPTCTKDGYTVVVCSLCGDEMGARGTLKATGHTWGKWVVDKDAGCDTYGTQHRSCNRCGAREGGTINPKGHRVDGQVKRVEPTCVKEGYSIVVCSNCGKEMGERSILPVKGHTWGAWVIDKSPSCEAEGKKHRNCTICSARDEVVTPKTGHSVTGLRKTVPATCVADGYTIVVCNVCGAELGEKQILPKTGNHNWGEWTVTKEAECEVDGTKYHCCKTCKVGEKVVIPKKGHFVTGVRKTVTPEHGGEGYTVVVCNRCGKEMSNRLLFDVPAPEVTIEFHVTDKHGEGVTQPLVVKVPYDGTPIGDIFPKVPNPKQYTITAWKDKAGKQYDRYTVLKSTQKVDLYPVWGNVGEYMIYFIGNGSEATEIQYRKVKYDESFTLPAVKELFDGGVGFEKWSTTPDGDGQVFRDGETRTNFAGKEPSITLYAMWNESGTATYYDLFNNVIKSDTITHKYKIKGLNDFPNLKLDGLVFKGWRKNRSATETVQGGEIKIADGNNWVFTPVYEAETGAFAVAYYDAAGLHDRVVVKTYSSDNIIWTNGNRNAAFKLPDGIFPEYDTIHYLSGWEHGGTTYKIGKQIDITWVLSQKTVLVMKAVWGRYAEEMYLYYGYDNKVEVITVKEDNYKLPVPERKGYEFQGWSTVKDDTTKIVGETYNVPKYGAKLYAIWNAINYSIEYYDGMTGEKIEGTETVTVESKIKADAAYIPGMIFAGWVEDRVWPYTSEKALRKLAREKVITKDTSIAEISFDKKNSVKLYSLYVPVDSSEGQTIVYFHPGKGSGVNDPQYFYADGELTLPECKMSVKGNIFTGWKLAGEDKVYSPGETYKVNVKKNKLQAVVFVAQWKSEHKITLDLNYPGAAKVDLSDKYTFGDYIMTADYAGYDNRKGYTLKGWEASQKGFCKPYGMADQIYVPNEDLTLTAIWSKNKYKVYYHSGFNEYVGFISDESYEKTKLTFDKTEIYWLEDPQYEFIGWTLKNPHGLPCDVDPADIITPENNREIVLLEDLHVYSCYKEKTLDVSDERVLVSYNWMGGTNGPKDEYFNPKKGKYHISSVIPERDGYAFEGWKSYDELVHDGNYEKYIVNNVLALYASWIPLVNNAMKDPFQREYGKNIMPDYMFLTEYETTEWRKINDYCYFAIKTTRWDQDTSDHYKEMDSIVLIIEYKDGKWELTGQSASKNWRKQLEYDILTSNTDLAGRVIKGLSDVAIKGLGKHPIFKHLINGLDFGSACAEAKDALGKGEIPLSAADKIASKVLDKLYDIYMDEFGDETFVSNLIMKVAPKVKSTVKDTLNLDKKAFTDLLDTMQKLCSNAAKDPYEFVDDMQLLLLQVDDYVDAEVGKNLLSNVYNKLDDIRVDGDKLDKLKTGLNRASKGLEATSFVLGIVFDNIDYQKSINQAMDPFGKMNLALKTFYDEIEKLEFDSNIKNTFGSVIEKIYNAYCKLK